MAIKKRKLELSIFILSIAGVLFAGYLSGVKLFLGICSFTESCPYVLGYPSCYYGFVMFVGLFVTSLLLILKKYKKVDLYKTIFGISLAGILFSGYLSIQELVFSFPLSECSYGLGLPTCTYGLFVYIGIFVLSNILLFRKK